MRVGGYPAVVAQARGVLGSTAGLSLSASQHLNSFIYSMRQDVLSNYNIVGGGGVIRELK